MSTEIVVEDEKIDVDLKDLYNPLSKWSPEQKIAAVMAFMTTGTTKQAAKVCGVPQQTISDWKNKADWWEDTLLECRKKKQDELDASFTSLVHSAVEKLEDRINQGDVKVDKTGNQYYVPMSGRDIAITMAVIFDKRQLLRGDPTARIEKVSEKDRINRLAKSFKNMALKMKESGLDTKVIDTNDFEELENG